MAVHRGQVAIGTLPSGRVHSMRVGQAVSSGRAIAPGLHEVVAVRRGPTVELHVDGALAAAETSPDGQALDLGVPPPVVAGNGPRAPYLGQLRAVSVETSPSS